MGPPSVRLTRGVCDRRRAHTCCWSRHEGGSGLFEVEGLRCARIELVSGDLVGSGFGMHQQVVLAVQQLPHQARILIAQSLQRSRVQAQEFILRIGQVPCSTLIFPPTPVSTSKANSPCASCDAKLLGLIRGLRCQASGVPQQECRATDVWLATSGDEIPKLSEFWNRSLFSESTYREDLTDRVRSAVGRRRSLQRLFHRKLVFLGQNSIHVTTHGSFVTVMILRIALLSAFDRPAMFHVKRVRIGRFFSAMFHVEREPLPSPA